MSRQTEEQTARLSAMSHDELRIEHLRMSATRAIEELRFVIQLMNDGHHDAALGELERLRVSLATHRYLIEYGGRIA